MTAETGRGHGRLAAGDDPTTDHLRGALAAGTKVAIISAGPEPGARVGDSLPLRKGNGP